MGITIRTISTFLIYRRIDNRINPRRTARFIRIFPLIPAVPDVQLTSTSHPLAVDPTNPVSSLESTPTLSLDLELDVRPKSPDQPTLNALNQLHPIYLV